MSEMKNIIPLPSGVVINLDSVSFMRPSGRNLAVFFSTGVTVSLQDDDFAALAQALESFGISTLYMNAPERGKVKILRTQPAPAAGRTPDATS